MIAWNFQRIVGTCQFRVPWFGYPCGYSSLTIRKLGFYYIDKTRLIEQLLQGWGKVTLLPALAVLVRLSI